MRSGLRRFRHQVWASTFQALGLLQVLPSYGKSIGLRRLRHEVWASSFQASGLGFDVLGMRSGLRNSRHQVWASTFQVLGLGFAVSGIRSGLQYSGFGLTGFQSAQIKNFEKHAEAFLIQP